jgi:methylmalonyl-CoA epimerase
VKVEHHASRGRFVKVDHIGVAVKDATLAAKTYTSLGFDVKGPELLEGEGVKIYFAHVGESSVELLESTRPESAIAKFIEKRGEGMHHVAILVDDMDKAIAEAGGESLTLGGARMGSRGMKVAFIHPKNCHGVLLEFVQRVGDQNG